MTQELREKVLSAWGAPQHDDLMPKRADAAIAIIRGETLEEAARECERMEKVFAPLQIITDRCAAAIRALKEGK